MLFTSTFISEKIKFKWPNYEKAKAYKLTIVPVKRSHSFYFWFTFFFPLQLLRHYDNDAVDGGDVMQ